MLGGTDGRCLGRWRDTSVPFPAPFALFSCPTTVPSCFACHYPQVLQAIAMACLVAYLCGWLIRHLLPSLRLLSIPRKGSFLTITRHLASTTLGSTRMETSTIAYVRPCVLATTKRETWQEVVQFTPLWVADVKIANRGLLTSPRDGSIGQSACPRRTVLYLRGQVLTKSPKTRQPHADGPSFRSRNTTLPPLAVRRDARLRDQPHHNR